VFSIERQQTRKPVTVFDESELLKELRGPQLGSTPKTEQTRRILGRHNYRLALGTPIYRRPSM
jgi:hypothetical protein